MTLKRWVNQWCDKLLTRELSGSPSRQSITTHRSQSHVRARHLFTWSKQKRGELYYHRTAYVGKDLKGHPVPVPVTNIFTAHISCITKETCNIKPMCRNTTVPWNWCPVLGGNLQVMKNHPHCLGESWWIATLTAQTYQVSGWKYCHSSCCIYLGFHLSDRLPKSARKSCLLHGVHTASSYQGRIFQVGRHRGGHTCISLSSKRKNPTEIFKSVKILKFT